MNEFYSGVDHVAILPAVMPALFGCALLLWKLVGLRESRWAAGIALMGFAFTGAALVKQAGVGDLSAFHGALTVDRFALFFAWVLTVSGAVVVVASPQKKAEYYALILFAQCGMFVLAAGTDLVTLFVGLELMSLCFYVLVAFAPERRSVEAAVKFLLLGGFSSALLAYGFSLLFGLAGSTLLHDVSRAVGARSAGDPLIVLAIGAVVAGMLFKISAAPFHMWTPDAYEGAPAPVTAYLAVCSKLAALALLLRLLPLGLDAARDRWQPAMAVAAVLTLTIGNLAAMTQTNLKRMLAYSSVAHAGYLLLGLVAGNGTGLKGVLVYTAVYAAMSMGAFLVLGALGSEDISSLSGLMKKSPWLALCMLLFLLSLTGIPPTAGFWGKYWIFLALLETGHYVLAIVSAVYVAVAGYYYFRMIRYMFLGAEIDGVRPRVDWGLRVAIGLSALATLWGSLAPETLVRAAEEAVR